MMPSKQGDGALLATKLRKMAKRKYELSFDQDVASVPSKKSMQMPISCGNDKIGSPSFMVSKYTSMKSLGFQQTHECLNANGLCASTN